MSVKYVPVQWNLNKWLYDAALVVLVVVYVLAHKELAPLLDGEGLPIDGAIRNAAAFGTCAFFMLTVILCIGPLARLSPSFLPLLYNRRHFGVLTCLVALSHVYFVLGWYFAFSPINRYEAVFSANTSVELLVGFPFEWFGVFAILCLLILATTSHDFWLAFLGPRLWKGLHYLIYPAYAAVVAHMALGVLQDADEFLFSLVVIVCAALVIGLHLAAVAKERRSGDPKAVPEGVWEEVCRVGDIPEGRARIARLSNGNRVAVFHHEGRLAALSNACAHQNGPLGEGRVRDGCATCPWHGFQYRLTDGCSPPPFTEKVPTYFLRIEGGRVLVNPEANPPGTPVDPVAIPTDLLPQSPETPTVAGTA